MADNKRIGQRIRDLRRLKRFNRAEELAEKANIPTSTLYRIENGDKAATAPELESLAQALNVPISELFVDSTLTTAADEEKESLEHKQRSSPDSLFDNKTATPLDALNAFLRIAIQEPVVNEHYRYLRRISQSSPADVRIGPGHMNLRLLLSGDNLETLLKLISLIMAYDERWKSEDD